LRYNVSQFDLKGDVMSATTMVHVRVDETIKTQAAETLGAMGLTVSDAIRVFLTRVVAEKQLPFTLRVPNAETRSAMAEADAIAQAHQSHFLTAEALFDDLEKNSRK
jgi:DNA-damage-inducible protein J